MSAYQSFVLFSFYHFSVLMGDFNAHHPLRGSASSNKLGEDSFIYCKKKNVDNNHSSHQNFKHTCSSTIYQYMYITFTRFIFPCLVYVNKTLLKYMHPYQNLGTYFQPACSKVSLHHFHFEHFLSHPHHHHHLIVFLIILHHLSIIIFNVHQHSVIILVIVQSSSSSSSWR